MENHGKTDRIIGCVCNHSSTLLPKCIESLIYDFAFERSLCSECSKKVCTKCEWYPYRTGLVTLCLACYTKLSLSILIDNP